jgi:hypothetical protein
MGMRSRGLNLRATELSAKRCYKLRAIRSFMISLVPA